MSLLAQLGACLISAKNNHLLVARMLCTCFAAARLRVYISSSANKALAVCDEMPVEASPGSQVTIKTTHVHARGQHICSTCHLQSLYSVAASVCAPWKAPARQPCHGSFVSDPPGHIAWLSYCFYLKSNFLVESALAPKYPSKSSKLKRTNAHMALCDYLHHFQ